MLNLDVIWSCRFSSSNSSIRFLSFSVSSWEFLSSALYLYNSFCIVMISEHRLKKKWRKKMKISGWIRHEITFEPIWRLKYFRLFDFEYTLAVLFISVSGLHHDLYLIKFVSLPIDGAELAKFGTKELPGSKIWY